MSNLLVIGGFTESKRLLEPVADEAVRYGFGNDADVLTLRQASLMDEERLRRLVAGTNVITHSAGITMLPDARTRVADSELPEDLIIIAGPEPRSPSYLAEMALWKTIDHVFGQQPDSSKAHMRVVRGNLAETIAHPFITQSLIPSISSFSTMERLARKEISASSRLGNFMMAGDEFYANHEYQEEDPILQNLRDEGSMIGTFPGGHDELLINPLNVLRRVRNHFDGSDGGLRLVDWAD